MYHRDSKPLKTIGHSHTDSLKRIGEALFLERGVAARGSVQSFLAASSRDGTLYRTASSQREVEDIG